MMRRIVLSGLLLFAVWQLGGAGWIHAKAELGQWLLERAWREQRLEGEQVEPWPGAVSRPIARLRMPRLSIDHLVLEGLETPVLAWGPGMATGSAGHRVIAAHRDTHFSFLRAVEAGDRFELVDESGQSQSWRVEAIEVVDSRRVGVDLDWPEKAVTLITCYPFDATTPGGPKRLIVRLLPLAGPDQEIST